MTWSIRNVAAREEALSSGHPSLFVFHGTLFPSDLRGAFILSEKSCPKFCFPHAKAPRAQRTARIPLFFLSRHGADHTLNTTSPEPPHRFKPLGSSSEVNRFRVQIRHYP